MSKASAPKTKPKTQKRPVIKYREDHQKSGPGETTFSAAVQFWWEVQKYEQWIKDCAKAQKAGEILPNEPESGRVKGGIRGGRSMDGFRLRIIKALENAGVPRDDIYPSKGEIEREAAETLKESDDAAPISTQLPSYFRATKNWDLVVCKNALARTLRNGGAPDQAPPPELVLAIEFKSQFGSVGKNQNNRVEEAIGSGFDLKCAIGEGVINAVSRTRPWVGYLFIGHYDDIGWEKPVDVDQPLIPADPVFLRAAEPPVLWTKASGWSYARRYTLLLDRLREQRIYDGTCFLTTCEEQMRSTVSNYICPFAEHSGEEFLRSLVAHARLHYPSNP